MATVIDSLLVRLGFSVDAKNLEGFAALTEKAKGAMLGFGAAVSGAFYGLNEMVKGAAERLGDINDFSEQMDMSARSVAALGSVAAANDSSLEAMESALATLTSTAGQAAMGIGRGKMIFDAFGLSARDGSGAIKGTEELLGDVADKMQSLGSIAERQALGSRLGFDRATVLLLSKGRVEFEKLKAAALEANPFTEADYEMAEKTDKMYLKAGKSIQLLKTRLAVGLMPTVNDLLKKFIDWTKSEANVAKVKDAVQKVADVCVLLANNLGKVAAVLGVVFAYKAGNYFMGLSKNVLDAANGMGSLNFALGGLSKILTGGILALILAIAEDLYVFSQGGESFTGWMLTKFPYAVDVMKQSIVGLSAALLALTTKSGPIGLIALGIGELILLIDKMDQANKGMSKNWAEFWDGIFDSVAKVVNAVTPVLRAMGADVGDMSTGVFSANLESRKKIEAFSPKKNAFQGYETGWKNLQPDWLQHGSGPGKFSTVNNSSTTTNNNVININGAQDKEAVARAVGAELDKRQSRAESADSARARTRNAQGATVL